MTKSGRTLTVSVDVGGTFTDVALVDGLTGQTWNAKTPTTPPEFEIGFIDGIRLALDSARRPPTDVARVCHATTVATNAILELRGAPSALLTTRGFRHVLEIGRHDIPRKANLYSWIKPRRPVAARHIHEIRERCDASGQVVTALDEKDVRAAAATIRSQGIQAVAICFLHSYANPAHELRARQILLEEIPQAVVSVSSEVLPVFREFERATATILNVYVMPLVASYVSRLEGRLKAHGIDAPLLLMKSSGGVASAATIQRQPVQTALSGPAAGVVGAVFEAAQSGHADLITVDVGGTSADICLIRQGRPEVTTKGQVGDWPLTLPMVDIHTIGAGGGSIARVTAAGTLSVGPESAGAVPGPLCYGRGGQQPTVTDAHLVLGHLPDRLLSGVMRLDREAAYRGIRQTIAEPLGLDVHEAAAGILTVMNDNMLAAIRLVSVERGLDPRDFVLFPFGGAGPLHGSTLARLLGARTVVVAPSPGVLSAQGLNVSSLRNEFSCTCLQDLGSFDCDAVAVRFEQLEASARDWLDAEQVPQPDRCVDWEAMLRYKHQGFELHTPWPFVGAVQPDTASRLAAAFHDLHRQLYSFALEGTPVELVGLRVTATGRLSAPSRKALASAGAKEPAVLFRQPVYVDGAMIESPVYDRTAIEPGHTIAGPAIVQQHDATILLEPGDMAHVHPHGALVIAVNPGHTRVVGV